MVKMSVSFGNITLFVALVVSILTPVSVTEPRRNPIVAQKDDDDGGRSSSSSSSIKVNYSRVEDNAGMEGLHNSGLDFSSIKGILQSLQMLMTSRDIRQVIPRPMGVNEKCYDETVNFLDALIGQTNTSRGNTKRPDWALKMFDAFGKPEAGLFEGSLHWVGAYEECLDVHATIPAGTRFGSRVMENSTEFDTNYCRAEIVLDPELWKRSSYAGSMNQFWKSDNSPALILNWGMCMPQSCHGADVQELLTKGISSALKLDVQDVICYEESSNVHEDAGAIFVIVLLSLFGSVVITCTILETFWHYARVSVSTEPPAKDKASQQMLNKDYTDITVKVMPPNSVVKEKVDLNGSSRPINPEFTQIPKRTENNSVDHKALVLSGGNGVVNHNGVGVHGKDFMAPEIIKQLQSNANGHEVKPATNKGSKNYQVNIACDEEKTPEGEYCRLDGEKGIPDGKDIKSQDEKDEKKSCLQETAKEPKTEGTACRLVQAFSMRFNLLRLLKTSGTSRPGVIRCIDGIRVISMLWIVLGHTYTFGAVMDQGNLMFANTLEVAKTTAKISFFLVTGASFAVDTFFLISGMLVTMLTLKDMKRIRPSCGFWSLFYLHRIWRLTPVYMVVLMFCVTMYDHTVFGPLKSQPLREYEDCHSKWWTHLLYINNLYQPRQKCMTWTWYLAVDMQLFALAPIIIYVIHRSLRVGLSCLLMLTATGMLSAFIAQYTYHGQFVLMDQVFMDYWQHVYVVPWTRIGAFAIGMFTGVVLLNGDQKPGVSKIQALCIWVALALVAIFLILIPHNQWKEGSDLWPQSVQALYEALSRPTWALCVALVIYMCHTGRGGVANNILSWPGFQPISRITYAVYLIHPVVMTFFLYSRNTPIYLQDTTIMYQYIGNVVLSYIFGTLLCVMFESPIMSLEKILLGGSLTQKRKRNNKNNSNDSSS